ncbi:MAG: hypothetical protein M0R28_21005 [Pigmentiphaga sp.]|nr:hypothetical protein [Pigmentiphaga sp.]
MSDETLSAPPAPLDAVVREMLPAALREHEETGAPIAEIMHAQLWPRLCGAIETELFLSYSNVPTAPTGKDRRAKPWQYVVRFWMQTPNGPELVGQTDPEIMMGTGEIPTIVTTIAAQLHEDGAPDELKPDAVKALLPQFRNNLGRANTATLRIPYVYADMDEGEMGGRAVEYLCQIDVYRLPEA